LPFFFFFIAMVGFLCVSVNRRQVVQPLAANDDGTAALGAQLKNRKSRYISAA
jgi:hypothetical protein